MAQVCVDRVVGEILAGWRYDISGLAPEMREDYEQHFIECNRCRSKQRLHRTIDFGLIIIASGSAIVFLLAFGAIRHFNPARALLLEIAKLQREHEEDADRSMANNLTKFTGRNPMVAAE